MTADSGTPEASVIVAHQGFNPRGSGGILDDNNFVNADFLMDPDYRMMTIEVQFQEMPMDVMTMPPTDADMEDSSSSTRSGLVAVCLAAASLLMVW